MGPFHFKQLPATLLALFLLRFFPPGSEYLITSEPKSLSLIDFSSYITSVQLLSLGSECASTHPDS